MRKRRLLGREIRFSPHHPPSCVHQSRLYVLGARRDDEHNAKRRKYISKKPKQSFFNVSSFFHFTFPLSVSLRPYIEAIYRCNCFEKIRTLNLGTGTILPKSCNRSTSRHFAPLFSRHIFSKLYNPHYPASYHFVGTILLRWKIPILRPPRYVNYLLRLKNTSSSRIESSVSRRSCRLMISGVAGGGYNKDLYVISLGYHLAVDVLSYK